ncbi:MAG TPA: hypothetical protein PLX03_07185 [Candidatus Hydrogenedentes bacterium]|nr:hypothetical protein [Candidatus Hydrogenedentota bacterium]
MREVDHPGFFIHRADRGNLPNSLAKGFYYNPQAFKKRRVFFQQQGLRRCYLQQHGHHQLLNADFACFRLPFQPLIVDSFMQGMLVNDQQAVRKRNDQVGFKNLDRYIRQPVHRFIQGFRSQ